jgi:hypothetical protein
MNGTTSKPHAVLATRKVSLAEMALKILIATPLLLVGEERTHGIVRLTSSR